MYSVVLLTALAASTSVPAHGHGGGYGYAPYSSYAGYACGGCYGGCYGYGCYGSGYGYNYGYSCRGCYGGCYGCCGGGYVPHYGCYGAGYGYHGGCYGAYGSWHGDPTFFGGCFGCHGGHSGYGIPVPIPDFKTEKAVDPFPAINPIDNKKPAGGAKEPEEVPLPKEKKFGGSDDKKKPVDDKKKPADDKKVPEKQVRVKVRIDVPDGARLFVDGQRINATGGLRLFQTPPLAPGQRYYYDIRIEIDRNGQAIGEQRRVIVEPGFDVAVAFPNLMPGTATASTQE